MGRLVILLSFFLFGITACAKSEKVTLADGSTGYHIKCNADEMNYCLKKAGEVCSQGYKTIGSSTDDDKTLMYNALLGGYQTIDTSSAQMVIKCK